MNRSLHHAAFALGLLAIIWVGAGYVPGNPLPLALVLAIGAFFLLGAFELHRFQNATDTLTRLLAATHDAPPSLTEWLAPLHPSLRQAVRLRVEGERVALPGPALTPYLIGLLVLLGMLGTFIGMVVTLKGTGLALEGATDLETIRASLAAPVKGLGLAFGTSVAGVAASATLGLMSTLARRERLRTAQQLDAGIATALRGFSQAHQRAESLRLLKAQAETAPALVSQLQALAEQMDRQSQALHDRLLASQAQFHEQAQRAYLGLAESVDRSLKASLAESARLAGAAIEPAVQATMAGLTRESAALHEALNAAAQQQLAGMTARLDATAAALAAHWKTAQDDQRRQHDAMTQGWNAALDRGMQAVEQRAAALQAGHRDAHDALTDHTRATLAATLAGFEQRAATLLRDLAEAQAARDAAAAAREQARMSALHDGLATMGATLEQTAGAITAQAEHHARATIGEITQLVQTASEAPRAAAEVIGEMRRALSDSLLRDNAALDERNRLMDTLSHLLDAVNHASTDQRAAIDALVQATSELLERAGARFAETVDAEARSLQGVSAQLTGSAAEVASLGEGFGIAVDRFSGASEQLMTQLQRIEAALGQSMTRSDEQLAYYVAQAREIVDLTLGSQKQIVEDLQQLAKAPADAARAGAPALEADAA